MVWMKSLQSVLVATLAFLLIRMYRSHFSSAHYHRVQFLLWYNSFRTRSSLSGAVSSLMNKAKSNLSKSIFRRGNEWKQSEQQTDHKTALNTTITTIVAKIRIITVFEIGLACKSFQSYNKRSSSFRTNFPSLISWSIILQITFLAHFNLTE